MDATMLHARVFESAHCSQGDGCAALHARMHFGITPLDALAPWLGATLHSWTSDRRYLHVTKPGKKHVVVGITCGGGVGDDG